MNLIRFILMILALVCFLLAALGVTMPRANLIAAGLFLWLFAEVIVRGAAAP